METPDLDAVVEEEAGAGRSGRRRRQLAPHRHGRDSLVRGLRPVQFLCA